MSIKEKGVSSDFCPECGGNIIVIQEKGETVCNQCGLVIDEKIPDFSHSGKRAFTTLEKKNREGTGPPISKLMPDIGLATVINRNDIENPELKRAAKWNSRITWEKRNLLIATTELKRISTNLKLPSYIKERAFSIYKQAFERKLLRGRSINGMVAACLYLACRMENIPRTLHEILNESPVKPREVRRTFNLLITELHIKLISRDPSSLVSRYIVELGLNSKVEATTLRILQAYTSRFTTSGKDPKGICAGALYLACKLKNVVLTQKKIAETIGVTEVTLRSRFKELKKKLRIPD